MSDELVHRPGLSPTEGAIFEEALEKARRTQGTILNDLETALNLIRHYQRILEIIGGVPDPRVVEARNLLTKYGMPQGYTKDQPYAIMSGGIDISTYPDSIPGSEAEVEELDGEEVKELPSGDDGNLSA